MKKNLLLTGVILLGLTGAVTAQEAVPQKSPDCKCGSECKCAKECKKPCHKPDFAARLNLTEEQKAKAKEIREKGHKEIKPVFDSIGAKHREIEEIKKSNLSDSKKEKKIEPIKKEIRELGQKAREIREKNLKEFEAILTDSQKKELETMKEEGKKRFEQHRRHDFGEGFRPVPPKQGGYHHLLPDRPVPVTPVPEVKETK